MNFDLEKIQNTLKIEIANKELFVTAFTHRSYLNEHHEYAGQSN